jgi:nicotinamide riboside kinase
MKLLIGFVGSPSSGKSTSAALLFSELKKLGEPVEFFPEYARQHIMEMRYQKKPIILDDKEQALIKSFQQISEDFILNNSGREVIVVTDGSSCNASFYCEQTFPEPNCNRYDILFYARPIETFASNDGNRVHDADFSKKIDKKMLQYFLEYHQPNLVVLEGSVEERLEKMMRAVFNKNKLSHLIGN